MITTLSFVPNSKKG
jgi:hypothetical protein